MTLKLFKNAIFFYVFAFLCLIITLFPPYSWEDERLTTQRERYQSFNGIRAMDALPIKQHDFLFNNSKKEFSIGWGWKWDWKTNTGESVKGKVMLSRHLIVDELIINYFLAFLISFIISISTNRFTPKHIN